MLYYIFNAKYVFIVINYVFIIKITKIDIMSNIIINVHTYLIKYSICTYLINKKNIN